MAIATFTRALGGSVSIYFDGGAHTADQLGQTKTLGTVTFAASTQSFTLVFCDAFYWRPSTALTSGWSFSYTGRPRTFFIFVVGQSNGEGRGLESESTALTNSTLMLPNTYPSDHNMGGASPSTQNVGPSLKIADTLLSNAAFRQHYDRVCVINTCTGGTSIAELFGTDGTDGNYHAQMIDRDVCGGPEDSLEPSLMRAGDDYALIVVHGETDVNDGTVADYAADITELTDYVRLTDFPTANCKAICHVRLPPTAPTGAIQANQDTCRSQQASLANANATPPVFVVDALDADRNAAPDDVHNSAAGAERLGIAMANAIVNAVTA